MYPYLVLLFGVCVLTQTVDDILNDIDSLYAKSKTYEYPENYNKFYQDNFVNGGVFGKYDFIIVGAGSAGTVLANRLSRIYSSDILLLEAGQNDTEYTDIPAMAPLLQFTDYNWGFLSTKQTNAFLGLTDNKCAIPRGKGLGGTSIINFMIYTRGNKHNFDHWNVEEWSYNDVFPYFNEIENCSLVGEENIRDECRRLHGDLNVEFVQNYNDFSLTFLNANMELGRKVVDYNGNDQMGFSRIQLNTIQGRRDSGNKAFLTKVLSRKNLHIQTGAFVTEIIIENEVAIGVKFVIGDKSYVAYTRKEVILSAGAIGSPQLLMLSGIGPKEQLKRLNIPVIKDLPVGQNLHEHLVYLNFLESNYTHCQSKQCLQESAESYLNGKGRLTAAGNIQAIGYINTNNPVASYPDVEYNFVPYFDTTNLYVSKGLRFSEESLNTILKPFPEGAPAIRTFLLNPKSRGNIKLKSNSPFDHPLINLNSFSHPDDIETLVRGLNALVEITETNAMKKYNVTISNISLPQCIQMKFLSNDYWRCMIKHLAVSVNHIAGTCKMGNYDDGLSVVDKNLNVHGIGKLRVVDSSIIPSPISGHINAATYMIAAKASDVIKFSNFFFV